jgi:hypothetical protein
VKQHRVREILVRGVTSHVGYLFETGHYKEPKASPTRDFPRIEYMKKSKYISEDERGGFKVVKVN